MPATAYTPTTTQPITNYIPVLQTAAANVARFDHNPVTGGSLGLLIEESRTNLLLRSEEFQTTWTAVATSISANTIVAPDGTLTGDKLTEDATNASHEFRQAVTSTGGVAHTLSVFAKAGERTVLRLLLPTTGNTSGFTGGDFDLVAGTVTLLGGATGSITAVGNGWYRCAITATTAADATAPQAKFVIGNTIYQGDGYSGIYIWGAQLEAGAFPTSYVRTEASQVTRSADVAVMTGANFSSWYRQDQGTIYSEAASVSDAADSTLYCFDDGTTAQANQIDTRLNAGVGYRARVRNGGVNSAELNPAAFALGSMSRLAFGYQVDSFAASANGLAAVTDTLGPLPAGQMNTLKFGFRGTLTVTTGAIRFKRLTYYPQRLTDAQLQALTT